MINAKLPSSMFICNYLLRLFIMASHKFLTDDVPESFGVPSGSQEDTATSWMQTHEHYRLNNVILTLKQLQQDFKKFKESMPTAMNEIFRCLKCKEIDSHPTGHCTMDESYEYERRTQSSASSSENWEDVWSYRAQPSRLSEV